MAQVRRESSSSVKSQLRDCTTSLKSSFNLLKKQLTSISSNIDRFHSLLDTLDPHSVSSNTLTYTSTVSKPRGSNIIISSVLNDDDVESPQNSQNNSKNTSSRASPNLSAATKSSKSLKSGVSSVSRASAPLVSRALLESSDPSDPSAELDLKALVKHYTETSGLQAGLVRNASEIERIVNSVGDSPYSPNNVADVSQASQASNDLKNAQNGQNSENTQNLDKNSNDFKARSDRVQSGIYSNLAQFTDLAQQAVDAVDSPDAAADDDLDLLLSQVSKITAGGPNDPNASNNANNAKNDQNASNSSNFDKNDQNDSNASKTQVRFEEEKLDAPLDGVMTPPGGTLSPEPLHSQMRGLSVGSASNLSYGYDSEQEPGMPRKTAKMSQNPSIASNASNASNYSKEGGISGINAINAITGINDVSDDLDHLEQLKRPNSAGSIVQSQTDAISNDTEIANVDSENSQNKGNTRNTTNVTNFDEKIDLNELNDEIDEIDDRQLFIPLTLENWLETCELSNAINAADLQRIVQESLQSGSNANESNANELDALGVFVLDYLYRIDTEGSEFEILLNKLDTNAINSIENESEASEEVLKRFKAAVRQKLQLEVKTVPSKLNEHKDVLREYHKHSANDVIEALLNGAEPLLQNGTDYLLINDEATRLHLLKKDVQNRFKYGVFLLTSVTLCSEKQYIRSKPNQSKSSEIAQNDANASKSSKLVKNEDLQQNEAIPSLRIECGHLYVCPDARVTSSRMVQGSGSNKIRDGDVAGNLILKVSGQLVNKGTITAAGSYGVEPLSDEEKYELNFNGNALGGTAKGRGTPGADILMKLMNGELKHTIGDIHSNGGWDSRGNEQAPAGKVKIVAKKKELIVLDDDNMYQNDIVFQYQE